MKIDQRKSEEITVDVPVVTSFKFFISLTVRSKAGGRRRWTAIPYYY